MAAHDNTHGTPVDSTTGVGQFNPFYCDTHTDCNGSHSWPDDRSWSLQVVTAMTNSGKDSSDPSLASATTSYNYSLATLSGNDVGDTWIPMGNVGNKDADWQAYYHGEFRGFPAVFTTSPSNTLTVDGYDSTLGWFTTQDNVINYTAGSLRQHDVYGNYQQSDWHLISRTVNTYAGDPGTAPGNSCNGNYSGVYTPCLVAVLSSRTTTYEQNDVAANSPWVQHDYTYDDFNSSGLVYSSSVYHNLLQETTTSSNAPTMTQKWTYQPTDTSVNGWVYYNVHKSIHSQVNDANGRVWQCQDTSYDEGHAAGVPAPAAGRPTTQTVHTDCSSPANQASSALSSYTGYDIYGNAVASVDAFGAANSSIYSTRGCTLTTAPAIISPSWTQSHYTGCGTYNSTEAQPTNQQNVLQQGSSISYDATQDALPISTTNANGQTTSMAYSYDSQGNSTVQSKLPGETSSYSNQSHVSSQCTDGSTLPCVEVDSNSSLYAGAVTRTFYDSLGRAVETRTPLDATHDLISFTVHNDANATTFLSEPFRVPSGNGWLDPNGATDENGNAPGGTVTAYDAIGRVLATQDAIIGSTAEPGVSCQSLSGTWSSCISYGLGTASGDSAVYHYAADTDANGHLGVSFTDALGRLRYSQLYSTGSSISSNITKQTQTQYNVLGKPTAVIVTDLAPQPGQTITSVTTTATYNDLGQQLTLSDPDRGSHTSSYDADGRLIKDVSGSRTTGISYDLLGRAICEQDAAPTTDGSGNCSSGSHPLTQNTYDVSTLGIAGSTDFSVGSLTQSVSTTYYPDGTSSATTDQVQHDQRGRTVTGRLQITVPSSWNTTLPTYQETQNYNDANQPMTTQTMVGSSPGYTFSQSYDGTTGALLGLSNSTIGNTSLVSQSYDLHGQVMGLNFPASNGAQLVNDHFNYDGDLRPASTTATWSASNTNFFSKSLTYDPVGNVISTNTSESAVSGQSNSGGGEVENFCYDEENRLVWAGNSGTEPGAGNGTCGTATTWNSLNGASYNTSYSYTHLGQLWQGPLNGTGSSLQYLYCNSGQPHQVTGLYASGSTCSNAANPSYSASYDNWGNETTRTYNGTTTTLSYDKLNELVQSNAGSTNQTWYAYGTSGGRTLMRSVTSSGTNLTVYAFGLEEHVYNGSGSNVSNTYYYSLGGRLIGKFDGTTTQYYLTDAQGSVLTTFSNAATTTNVLGYQAYGPYGNKLASSGSMGTAKGFTGQYQDPSGLDYYNARYYDPVIGCFISADVKQGNAQGMDPYSYVNGNPETLTDPTGQSASHCHDPGDCGPASNNDSGSITQYGGGGCDALCDGAIHVGVTPTIRKALAPTYFLPCVPGVDAGCAGPYVHKPTIVKCADDPQCLASFNASHAQADRDRTAQMDIIGLQMAFEALDLLNPAVDDAEAQDIERLQQLEAEGQQEEQDLADTYAEQCSFTPQTEVTTADGKQAIGTLQKGEKVLAYNPKTQKMELQPILHVWVNKDNDLVDLTITSTTSAQHGKPAAQTNEVVHTNQKHPFLTTEQGFVPVAQLHVGMHVLKADGSVGVISMWSVVPGEKVMYNLEVSQDHTFTVGDGQWIVHNLDCGGSLRITNSAWEHITDRHIGIDGIAASVRAARLGPGKTYGVFDDAATARDAIENVVANSRPEDWVAQNGSDGLRYTYRGSYSSNIGKYYGGTSSVGTSTSLIYVVMEPNGDLVTAYPVAPGPTP